VITVSNRVLEHPILSSQPSGKMVGIFVDGKQLKAREGEMIAAALIANGIRIHRYTVKRREPRGIFCGIGQCTDCVMKVNGRINVRTCITPVEAGMRVETQYGVGRSGESPGSPGGAGEPKGADRRCDSPGVGGAGGRGTAFSEGGSDRAGRRGEPGCVAERAVPDSVGRTGGSVGAARTGKADGLGKRSGSECSNAK
jgi:hypothetical protein